MRPRLVEPRRTTPHLPPPTLGLSAPPDETWAVDERSLKLFAEQLKAPPTDRAWYDLRREAERIALVPGFDRLITLDANAIKELPHQIDVAQRVLLQLGGRAIHADEVGLCRTTSASCTTWSPCSGPASSVLGRSSVKHTSLRATTVSPATPKPSAP